MASSSSFRSRHTKSTGLTSNSSRRSSAYDKDFEQHYIDHHVYPEEYEYSDDRQTPEPGGLDDLYQRLSQPRPSLSPSRFTASIFRDLKRTNARVIDEGEVMRHVFPIIAGNSNIPNKENLQFTRLESMTNGVTVDPKPDFYDGAHLEDIDKSVREELSTYIIPTGHRTAPVASNFFMEAKAPHGAADVVRRQAMQNGAYGARAMHSLQSYSEGKPVYDGNAYTITSTYHAGTGTLKLYVTHPTCGEDGISPEYHISQVKGWDLTGNINTFREAATAFRNARDWAQEQRDTFITAANARARSSNPEPTRTEGMTYPGWLATLDQAQESSVSNQDSEYPDYNPGETQEEYAEPFERRSSATYEGSGHAYTAPSTFASDFNVPVDNFESSAGAEYLRTESSIFDSPTYSGLSDAYPIQESETSTELALDSNVTPATRSKRQHGGSERKASKAPRHSHSKSGQSRHRR